MISKKELRTTMRAARRALTDEERRISDQNVTDCFFSLNVFDDATCILLYSAVDGEVNVSSIAREAFFERKAVGFPRIEKDGTMTFRAVRSLLDLTDCRYGIPEPPADAPVITPSGRTILLVPALAYDRSGYRLGMGGGYYDRYLADFPGLSVGIIRKKALLDILPREAHDLPVDVIVTENKTYKVV